LLSFPRDFCPASLTNHVTISESCLYLEPGFVADTRRRKSFGVDDPHAGFFVVCAVPGARLAPDALDAMGKLWG